MCGIGKDQEKLTAVHIAYCLLQLLKYSEVYAVRGYPARTLRSSMCPFGFLRAKS